jgi:hypothetical protein
MPALSRDLAVCCRFLSGYGISYRAIEVEPSSAPREAQHGKYAAMRWDAWSGSRRVPAHPALRVPLVVTGSLGQLPLKMRDDDLGKNPLSQKPVVLEVEAVKITDLAVDDPAPDKIINGLPEPLVHDVVGDQAP